MAVLDKIQGNLCDKRSHYLGQWGQDLAIQGRCLDSTRPVEPTPHLLAGEDGVARKQQVPTT